MRFLYSSDKESTNHMTHLMHLECLCIIALATSLQRKIENVQSYSDVYKRKSILLEMHWQSTPGGPGHWLCLSDKHANDNNYNPLLLVV
jgi:hypothetical protein